MKFTNKDRAELDRAQRVVEELAARKQLAVDIVTEACREAGLTLSPGNSWHDLCDRHADAIRDALDPFDSGVRCKEQTDN